VTKTYEVRTYGCQMNVHDSERLGGLLDLRQTYEF
jgi:tRNA-2-methylthio-N6-dimethylallyladenosine synthase